METQFRNLFELQRYFDNEDKCWEYLEKLRWSDKITCPFCKSEKHYKFQNSRTYKCADCKKKFNAKIGTIFENSKVPLAKWFVSIYIATSHKKGISSIQLSKDIGVTQKTAWFILHRIREMLNIKAPQMLTGIVEIDETYIGGKAKLKRRGKRVRPNSSNEKLKIFGILDRKGSVHTELVDFTDARMLVPIIKKHVNTNATMVTDAYGSYQELSEDYKHVVINHSNNEWANGKYHTNTIEGYWAQLKRGVYGIYHHISRFHTWRYLAEFQFRYNTQKIKEAERFDYSLLHCEKRLKYNELIGKFD